MEAESTLVHSPGAHYHSQTANKNITSSSSENGDSDVSDMVVENSSRFDGLSKERRKSGGSDYRPRSASNSSESESESVSNSGSYSERSTPFSQKQNSTRLSGEDSEATSRSRSVSMTPVHGNRFKNSTAVVRKSPLNVTHRSAPSEVTAMRGYRYSMLPSRSAAANVSYSRYLEEESDSDCGFYGTRKRGRKQLAKDSSESEFEVGGKSEESVSEELTNSDDDFSEDEHRPSRRKARRGRQKVRGEEGRGEGGRAREGGGGRGS